MALIFGSTYLAVGHHGKIGLETVRRSIYSTMRQSVLSLRDRLLRVIPGSSGISETTVSCVVLVFLRRSKGVEVSLHAALRLCVEFCLKGRKLLGHSKETTHFYAKNNPDYVCERKRHKFIIENYILFYYLSRKRSALLGFVKLFTL